MKPFFLFLFFWTSFAFSGFSQTDKIEIEKHIDKEEMPDTAVVLFEKATPENIRRLRFYFEKDGKTESYEIKFKHQRHWFSVEFGTEGNLQDVEVELKEKQLPKKTLHQIVSHIQQNNERFTIENTEAQYKIKTSALVTYKRSLHFKENTPDNYELIVAVKNKGKLKRFEMLFSSSGKFLYRRKIIRNSYDHLIF